MSALLVLGPFLRELQRGVNIRELTSGRPMEFGSGFWHRFELRKSKQEASVVEVSAQENVVYIRSSERGGKPKLKKQICNSAAEAEVALGKHIADVLKLGYEHIESKF